MRVLAAAALAGAISAPTQALAQGYIAPWAGVTFGKDLGEDFIEAADDGRAAFGVSAGAFGGGVFGGEFDLGYAPTFFGTEDDFGSNTVLTVMGNLILGIPIGGTAGPGVQPYVTGGLGLIRTQADGGDLVNEGSNNDWGYNLGGGINGYFSDHIGLRGDLRYFRSLEGDDVVDVIDFNLGAFSFWRASIGLVIR
jgi:hypothetical protein